MEERSKATLPVHPGMSSPPSRLKQMRPSAHSSLLSQSPSQFFKGKLPETRNFPVAGNPRTGVGAGVGGLVLGVGCGTVAVAVAVAVVVVGAG